MLTRVAFIILTLFVGLAVLAGCQSNTNQNQSDGQTEERSGDEPRDENGQEEADEDTGMDGDHEDEDAASAVEITLSEFSLSPSDVKIKAGETVTFRVKNEGSVFHTYTIADGGESARLNAGDSEDLKVTFDEPGTHEVKCTVPGHAARGMTGEITVE